MSCCKHPYCKLWNNQLVCYDCYLIIADADVLRHEYSEIERIAEEDTSIPEDTVNRGITIEFLLKFTNDNDLWDLTTAEVCRKFIIPVTHSTRCCYVELPDMIENKYAGKAVTFISHSWASKFGDLVAAVSEEAGVDRVVWIDIFAVRQFTTNFSK
jgi:hypothetical protein